MSMFVKRTVGTLAGAALAAAMLAGCKFFDIGNPLLPKARLVAFPNPSVITVRYTHQPADCITTVEAEDAEIEVRTFARDASPGVILQGYTAEYFDQTGVPIASLLISKVNFGVSAYLPPATGQDVEGSRLQLTLPIYNQQVSTYGRDQVYVRPCTNSADLNRQLIHTINCRVTLFGIDDNFNEVEVPLSVPIRFDGQITK